MSRESREYFEGFKEYGPAYSAGIWRAYRRLAYELVEPRLAGKNGLAVLDLGGGALISLPDLLADPRVASYTVVDLVDHLQPRPAKVSVVQSDILAYLSGARERFDVIVVFGVLMYLEPDQAARALAALPALMKEGASVVVHEPNRRAEGLLDASLERPVDIDAAAAGLSVVRRQEYNTRRLRPLALKIPILPFSWLLAAERLLGSGVDSLYLLQRAPAKPA